MKKAVRLVSAIAALSSLAACVAPLPPVLNANGKPYRFVKPMLSPADRDNGIYVLIEKNIADGHYRLLNVSPSRQPIQNERQERIVFNRSRTQYAPDFTQRDFHTYTDRAFYNTETVVMNCDQHSRAKLSQYSPCSSFFGHVFVPTGVAKVYVAGQMSYEAHRRWEDPQTNLLRVVEDPEMALREAGAFEQVTQFKLQ
ncbi:hypothetical protein AWB79_05731 [Caballeronia hypogeia]|uniref:Lipoprotein n=1 Tax=Caballeronia hypogeia TaxID=1777140 RepID=A0A158CP98_9BURK|nr:hypothetical protein [Caballeronia hypogeia]SAK84184.1 hypothetical protein AWB79_05731 [Caballeronia hypogeia]